MNILIRISTLLLMTFLFMSFVSAKEPKSSGDCKQNNQAASQVTSVNSQKKQAQPTIIKVGEPAPDFWGHTAGGEVYDYGRSFKGKTILLIFWSMNDPSSKKLNKKLRQIRQQFINDKNLIMVSQCVDQDFTKWMKYCNQQKDVDGVKFYNDPKWIQQTQGGFDLNEINSAKVFGVKKTPALFLIGPDRKFLGVDIPQKDLVDLLENALKKQTESIIFDSGLFGSG